MSIYKESYERLRLEHNKLVEMRDEYGLTSNGHDQLHLAHFCLTGDLQNTLHVEVIE